jgi:4-amino-4-deoxy-L-arabinose transferase-like glycosyltransferase
MGRPLDIRDKISDIRRNWGRVILAGVGIVAVCLFLRLFNLTLLPVFADEAIYIRWSQVMKAEPTLRFLPLSDGKQPLFMWLMMPILGIIRGPLFAGRILSVLCGLVSLAGVFALGVVLFKDKKIALLASFFYAIIPFTVFFDRMALADSLLNTFGIWILFLALLLAVYQRLDLAMITGMILGGALITKSPAMFFAVALPVTILLIKPKNTKTILQIIKLVGLWLIVYLFAISIYNLLRLGVNFQLIAIRNRDYVFPLAEIIRHPLFPFIPNFKDVILWHAVLLTWPVFFLGLLGIGSSFRKNPRIGLVLLSWWLGPLVIQSATARAFTSRYILFSLPPFIIFSALGATVCLSFLAQKLKSKTLVWLVGIAILALLPLWFNFYLLTNPEKLSLPRDMRSGYLEEWTAGQGIKEAASYLRERAKSRNVLVGTEGYFGTLPDGLQMYLEKVPHITIIGVGLYLEEVPESLTSGVKENEVYLLINDDRLSMDPEKHHLRLIAEYPKANRPNGKHENLQLFRLEL